MSYFSTYRNAILFEQTSNGVYRPKILLISALVVLPTKPVPAVKFQGVRISEVYFS